MANYFGDNLSNDFDGGDENDNIYGYGESDTLHGNGGNDFIAGGDGFDYLEGGEGDDSLLGGNDNDLLFGGEGADVLSGGSGIDMVIYAGDGEGININLTSGVGHGGDAEGDTLLSIEDVVATGFDDTLIGSNAANMLNAGNGADWLEGLGGNDTLYAGDGADIVSGGAGADTLAGGTGIDLLTYYNSASGVSVNLLTGQALSGDAHGDIISGFENLVGSNSGDWFVGTNGANTITGYSGLDQIDGAGGNDTLNGDQGDDMLTGGAGSDVLNGGAGVDMASYEYSASGVSINLDAGTAFGGDASGDVLSSIADLIGSSHADTLVGDAGANVLVGRDGADTLNGAAGIDRLAGGNGADTLDGGAGADNLQGNNGNDTYIVDDAGDTVLEVVNYGFDTVVTALASHTLAANVEKLQFTGGIAHTGQGNLLNNDIFGSTGDDTFLADAGGADWFNGHDGFDTMNFSAVAAATVNLSTLVHGGSAAGDWFSSIEKFFGSNTGGDTMTAGAAAAIFYSQGGSDVLTGGAGNDIFSGGAGADNLTGGGGVDTLRGGKDADMLTGGAAGDRFVFGETAASGGWGADTVGDWQDGLDKIKIDASEVSASFDDFTITGNGTSSVLISFDDLPSSTIELNAASAFTITAADFLFF